MRQVKLEPALLMQAPRKTRAAAWGVCVKHASWRMRDIMLTITTTQVLYSQEE